MADIYDWEQEDRLMLERHQRQRETTRIGCKQCLGMFVRARVHDFDVVFISGCSEHEGWEPEQQGAGYE